MVNWWLLKLDSIWKNTEKWETELNTLFDLGRSWPCSKNWQTFNNIPIEWTTIINTYSQSEKQIQVMQFEVNGIVLNNFKMVLPKGFKKQIY